MEILYCRHCKNLLMTLEDLKNHPVCCNEEMKILKANTTDGALEKHVPVVNRFGNVVEVQVGSVEHPMTPEHWIQTIIVVGSMATYVEHLTPSDRPKATFVLKESEEIVEVLEFCNLHGLWKA